MILIECSMITCEYTDEIGVGFIIRRGVGTPAWFSELRSANCIEFWEDMANRRRSASDILDFWYILLIFETIAKFRTFYPSFKN